MGRSRFLSLVVLLLVITGELYFIAWLWGFGRVGRVFTNNYLNPAFFQFGKFNVLGVSKQQLLDKMGEYDPELSDVEIIKKLNGDIYINVKGRESKYILADKNEKRFFVADKRGVVIGEVKQPNRLIIVTNKVGLKLGSRMNLEAERAALVLVNSLANYPSIQGVSKLVIQDNRFLLVFTKGLVVTLPIAGEPDVYLKSLQILLDRFTIEGSLPREIDLRYSKPVVKM